MKKQTISLFALALSASGLFYSCDNNSTGRMGALEFDSLQVNQTEHLFADTAKPACNLTINFSFVAQSNDEAMPDSLNNYFLSACLGHTYMNMPPQAAIDTYAKKYAETYRNDLESVYQKDAEENKGNAENIGSWYNYQKGLKGSVQYYEKQLLVYRIDYNEYTGGAHGMYTSSFINIDLRTLTPVRLADLFVPDYKEALTDLLWNQLMADNRATTRDEIEEMGYASTGDLEPTENFFLSPKGITFYYNVYDIAPYAMGPVQITLPFEAMQHLINDNKGIVASCQ